jgi:hypothetical protein
LIQGAESTDSLPQTDVSGSAVTGSTLSTARFMIHLKQHGLTYAIVALLLEQAGILQSVLDTAGGMC